MARKARKAKEAPAAISRKLAVVNSEPEPITLELPSESEGEEASAEHTPVLQPAPEQAQEAEHPLEEAPSETKAEESSAEQELILGKYKSVDDLVESYKSLQAKATQTAQEKAEQERFYKELLKTVAEKPKEEETPIQISPDLADKLYSNPEEALAEITKVVAKNVRKEIEAEREKEQKMSEQEDQNRTLMWLNTEQAELKYGQDEDATAMIDGFALKAPPELKTYRARYEYAVKKYQKLLDRMKGEVRPEVLKETKEIEDMKRRATLQGSSAPKVAPTLSRAAIVELIAKNPAEYERRQAEIMRAYKEGRVK